jgi:hypothetical protein
MNKLDLARDLVRFCTILQDDFLSRLSKMILQVLARSMLNKIKQDQARLRTSSKIKLD